MKLLVMKITTITKRIRTFHLDLQGDVTIIFYFDANDITFLVEPTGSGNMSIQGNSVTSFPYSQGFVLIIPTYLLGAQPNLGWEMGYWSSTNHSFSPTNY